ncbi:MAG: DUF5911 domain-containing protein, partial [Actinomycetota bacterium]|nr:DUF5911 domain-containing protein [Actinomycetota bacterium]
MAHDIRNSVDIAQRPDFDEVQSTGAPLRRRLRLLSEETHMGDAAAEIGTKSLYDTGLGLASTYVGPPFPPIADYGLLSDCESTCLVASSGNVEWMCLPRPDSPSVFGALLD